MTDLQAPIGIALVGTGFGLKVHLPALRDCPDTKVVAVYHRDRAQAEAIAQTHEISSASDNFADLLSRPDIQGVCLSTPPFLHYEMATQSLEAGKHLFLEKPATMTASQAKALYDRSRRNKLQIALNFEFRHIPAWMALKAKLEDNFIGKPRLIKIDWLVPGRADANRPWSWHASAEAGGGSLGALGSHVFDYVAWLFGPIRQVSGRLATTVGYRPDSVSGMPKAVDADDTCLLLLELQDGTPVQVCISATTYNGRGHWVEVYGDLGALKLGSSGLTDYVHGFKLWGAQRDEPLEELPIPAEFEFPKIHPDGRIAPVHRVMNGWIDCIRSGQMASPSIREGVYAQLLMDRTQESHETGCWVSVPDLSVYLDE
jgi:predicted dehydrogenase